MQPQGLLSTHTTRLALQTGRSPRVGAIPRWFPAVFLASSSACGDASPLDPTGSTSEDLQQCAGPTVEGIDIYDGTGTVTWSAVKAAGIDFAIIKATQGTYNTQSTFPSFWSGAKAAGLVRSAYHFFDPTEDGVAQAQHFLSVVGSLAADDLPAMLDIECPDGSANCLSTGSSGTAPAASIHQRMWDWIHAVETSTGKSPLIYSYGSYFSSNGIDTTGLSAYPLNIADVTTASCFNVPSPWTKATVWQYSWTGTVNGIKAQVDRDRFLGTLSDLQAFARGGASAAQNEPNDGMASAMSDVHVSGNDSEAGQATATDASRVGEGSPFGGSNGADGSQGALGANAMESSDGSAKRASATASGGQGGSGGCACRVGARPEALREEGLCGLTALMTATIARRRRTASGRADRAR